MRTKVIAQSNGYELFQDGSARKSRFSRVDDEFDSDSPKRNFCPLCLKVTLMGVVVLSALVGFAAWKDERLLQWVRDSVDSARSVNKRQSVCPTAFEDTSNDDGSSPCPGTVYSELDEALIPTSGYNDGCNDCYFSDGYFSCTRQKCQNTCTFGYYTYQVGETVPHASGDACNTCKCQQNGQVVCTTDECNKCSYEGLTYASGSSFYDGCNYCICNEDTTVTCATDKSCYGCTYMGELHSSNSCFQTKNNNRCACLDDQTVVCTDCLNY